MSRSLLVALVACVGFSASFVKAEDFSARMLKYFPGKWEIKDPDGTSLGTVDWKLVAGGRAVAGPTAWTDGGSSYAMSGWDIRKQEWIHNWFGDDGSRGFMAVRKAEGDMLTGGMYVVDADGKIKDGPFTIQTVSDDHCVVTETFDDEKVVIHFHRKKD